MSAKNENWQIMVDGQIYETDFDGLKDWVAEGCFHLTDKVKKGSLNWIEAGKVPMLRRLFASSDAPAPAVANAPAPPAMNDLPSTPVIAVSSFVSPEEFDQTAAQQILGGGAAAHFTPNSRPHFDPYAQGPGTEEFVAPMPPVPSSYRPVAGCYYHPDLHPKFMCKSCANTFCDSCVKFVNGRIPLCTLCGELCDGFEKVRQRVVREHLRKSGFGFEDFGAALVYPFKHPVSLFAGAAIYAVLLIAGLFGNIAAYMMIFGCMTLTIQQVAWGRLDRCFMPEDDFSFWDDMIHPAILGIGITIVTWGPAIVFAVILVFQVLGAFRDSNAAAMSGNTDNAQITRQDFDDLNSQDPAVAEKAAKKIEAAQHPASVPSPSDDAKKRAGEMFARIVASSLPLLGLLFVGLLWGFLYYPMALTVAGYTRFFGAVVNPLVGLDTIKRMGSTYVKAFLMYLAVAVVGAVITIFIWVITLPFDMPLVGNLPGKVLNGVVTFYTSLVIACILGLSLYKSSDKLNIVTD